MVIHISTSGIQEAEAGVSENQSHPYLEKQKQIKQKSLWTF